MQADAGKPQFGLQAAAGIIEYTKSDPCSDIQQLKKDLENKEHYCTMKSSEGKKIANEVTQLIDADEQKTNIDVYNEKVQQLTTVNEQQEQACNKFAQANQLYMGCVERQLKSTDATLKKLI